MFLKGSQSSDKTSGGAALPSFEEDWLDSEVLKAISIHKTFSSIKSFVDNVDMLDTSLPDNVFVLRCCSPTDRVFHCLGLLL